MSLSLQQYIFTLIESLQTCFGPFRVQFKSFDSSVEAYNDSYVGIISNLFVIADAVLYVGIIIVIAILGARYRYSTAAELSFTLLRASGVSLYMSLIINIAALVIALDFLNSGNLLLFGGSYTYSLFSQVMKIVMLVILGALYMMFPTVLASKIRLVELPLLMQISAALCSTVICSTNFALLLLALEGFSLTLYIMTALGRSYGGVTASVKYFAFGTLGSIFLFWGVVHIYAIVPSLSFEVVNALLLKAGDEPHSLGTAVDFATTAISFGFMLKLGAAPVHQWVADVYAGAHMYITAFFSVFVKLVLFVVFLHIGVHFNSDALLNQFIVFSLIIGCFMSINQTEIKRFLAYSSVVHVAFLFMGDSTGSLIYLFSYVSSSLIVFSVLLAAELSGKELIYMNDLRFLRGSGLFHISCLVVALASSAGLPPFAGFYGKFLVWTSLIEDIYVSNSFDSYVILFVSIGISLVTIYYYMRVIAYLFIGNDVENRRVQPTVVNRVANGGLVVSQALLSVLVVGWTLIQPYILPVVQQIVLST